MWESFIFLINVVEPVQVVETGRYSPLFMDQYGQHQMMHFNDSFQPNSFKLKRLQCLKLALADSSSNHCV